MSKDLPTFEVKQIEIIEHTWIIQCNDKPEAEEIALTSDPDNSNELETLSFSVVELL